MPPRNPTNKSINDTTQQASCSYLRDFSVQYREYLRNPNDENLSLIRRSVSLLSTIPIHHFNLMQLETTQFFVDLHGLIGVLDNSDELWPCIALLQNCTKNPDLRRALIEDFRFIPLLTSALRRTPLISEKARKLLTLIEDLTFGISITWEEPYLRALLDLLQRTVIAATEEEEEKQAMLALSIMINLCYKNLPVLLLFMQTINISDFSRKIQRYGALAYKMMIVLSEDVYRPELKELHLLLRSSFASIPECLRDWNVAHLRHIVDFLTDSQSHTGLYKAMLQYANYCEDIEKLLGLLEENSSANDSKEETRKQRQQCLGLIFKLIQYILKLSSIPDKDGNENIISLESNVPRIFELICHWIESDICGTDAVRLLDGLIHSVHGDSLTPRIARDPSIVIQLINITENTDTTSDHIIAILQLLLSLLKKSKTEKLILSKISESFFDKMFSQLFAATTHSISSQETEKTIFCLLLLINFAEIAKKAYFEKCCTTLQMPRIQKALALATLSGSKTVCNAVFQIYQFEHFPREAVAEDVAILNSSRNPMQNVFTPPEITSQQLQSVNEILKTNRQFESTATEERLLALIEYLTDACKNNQLNNVPTTQIMELYNYKIEKDKCVKSNMQRLLDNANNEITNLRQQLSLQNSELEKYHNINFEMQINFQSIDTQSQNLKKQRDELKRNLADLLKKSSQQSESLQIVQKRLSVKTSEFIALNKEFTDLKEEMQIKNQQIGKLENLSKESVGKIDKLKKSVGALEAEINEKTRLLEEKERQLVKLNKSLESEKEAKKKSDDFITVLEAQIQEKNEEIRNYERELTETEEMRKTIMSLMESKKPKRKT